MGIPKYFFATSLSLLVGVGAQGSASGDAALPSYQTMEQCLSENVLLAPPDTTIAQLRKSCRQLLAEASHSASANSPLQESDIGALGTRLKVESISSTNRFVLTPHKRTYVLPANYTRHPNTAPFAEAAGEPANLQNTEIEFQLSLKILIAQDLLHNNGNLYIAYTNQSFWQAYNDTVSRPFRETNHEPELILSVSNDWSIFGFRNIVNHIGLVHQSNGQSGSLSRSWNRIRARAIFARGNLALALSPWYRLPEDIEDDDNPDIEEYLGHYELGAAYSYNDHIFDLTTRRPFSDKGSIELGWSFPIRSTVRGYLKYFNGYGASLIDYNVETESLGIGVVFSDLF